jgi:transposase
MDHDGPPIAFELTGGEAADAPMFEALIDAGPDDPPRAMVGDKGYDSAANRAMARDRGAVPVIPHRSNRKTIPARFARALYRGRARIEQIIGKLKRFKRVALRCEKTARNFRSVVALAGPSSWSNPSTRPNNQTGPVRSGRPRQLILQKNVRGPLSRQAARGVLDRREERVLLNPTPHEDRFAAPALGRMESGRGGLFWWPAQMGEVRLFSLAVSFMFSE